MKPPRKKGLSMPMEVIIGVVILIVIALAVILFTSGSITKTGTRTDESGKVANDQIICNTKAISYCNANPGGSCDADTDCSGCISDVPCT
ncbi:MAG: hypothetical protein ABIF85_06930 [Nanoarchaeota archaeon]|nr:hypothetical protein [Nanoarchaeota archaeon]MBU4299852.1 hypothetical protein [Nanoarchaeota archaeon]MBU4451677.1 hypothetical protein [Nanoarchaeota archaeon]MCG2723618.1 hypothetical protein [archaeon]